MLIPREEFNNQKLLEVYQGAYMEAEMDDDGDVKISQDGIKLFGRVDMDRHLLVLFALFGLKPETTRPQALELANKVNDELILIRCAVHARDSGKLSLWLDHMTVTDGGITGEEIIRLTRRFGSLCAGIWDLDKEDIIN